MQLLWTLVRRGRGYPSGASPLSDLGVSVPTGGYLVTSHALGGIASYAPPKPTMSMASARPPRRLIGAQLAGGAPEQGHGFAHAAHQAL
jgi:hypothetical protein